MCCPQLRRALPGANSANKCGSLLAGGDIDIHGDPEGENDLPEPTDGADPSMTLDAIAPPDPLIDRSEGESPPTTPTKLQDLLKKHQSKKPDG
jgi:hypothetical protein